VSGEGLLYTGSLDLTLPSTLGAVVVARDSTPVALMLSAVGGARLGKLAALITPKATLADVGTGAETGAAIATPNAALVLLNSGVPHIYYNGRELLIDSGGGKTFCKGKTYTASLSPGSATPPI
jgi:hypothetical protein